MARNAAGFDEFYRATSGRVLRYGYAVTGDLAEAQDVVQEAYTRAWRDWRQVERHPAPEAWVRLVVSRLATDRYRRTTGWLKAVARTGPPPVSTGPPSEDTVLLTTALRRLPAAQRQALALHYLFDLSVAQIAHETGAAEGTVKSWLSRGRAALAAELTGSAAGGVTPIKPSTAAEPVARRVTRPPAGPAAGPAALAEPWEDRVSVLPAEPVAGPDGHELEVNDVDRA